jgi:hypothetical protein
MKLRARWSHIAIALGVIAALAIAAPAMGISGSIKKLIRKEVSKQIGKATGPAGANGINGTNGTNGTNGANGAAGTARAYARVFPHSASPCAPGCTFGQSKGVTTVTHPSAGTYCVTAPGLDSATTTAAATVEWSATTGPEGNASAMIYAPGCLGGQFQVITERQPATTVCTNDACTTTASVAGSPTEADNVAFTIVIP